MKAFDKYGGNLGNPCQNFVLTVSEFAEIYQRMDESKRWLNLINDNIDSKESLLKIRQQIAEECEKMSVKLQILKFKSSQTLEKDTMDIYEVQLKGMLLNKQFMVCKYPSNLQQKK